MFKKGKTYRIMMHQGSDGPTEYGACKVVDVKLPLIKVIGMTIGEDWENGVTILNTSSPSFISAQPTTSRKKLIAAEKKLFTPKAPAAGRSRK